MTPQTVAKSVIRTIRSPVRGRMVCLVCHGVVAEGEQHVRLRGNGYVHRECATYEMRLKPVGTDRLGTPHAYAGERLDRRLAALTGD
ncbi:MAG: hypothetical protein WD649_01680 [Thermoleophilaceae bacterium]